MKKILITGGAGFIGSAVIQEFQKYDYEIFVIDNLFIEYKDGGVPCERLCEIFHKYMEMYMKTRQESFTDDDLTNLEVGLYLFLDYAFFKDSINLIDKLLWTIQK